MIKSSSKYNMAYFNIRSLEGRLNKTNLSTSLWGIPKSKLSNALRDCINNSEGKTLSFLKDVVDKKDTQGKKLFQGLFVVACERELNDTEMEILFTKYLAENPNIDRSIEPQGNSAYNFNKNPLVEKEDLNVAAENLDSDNLVFGVIDDITHLDEISNIEGIDIIKDFGDFKKVYFSIPSYRQDEVLAHSVTILESIKCKRALEDFIL